MKRSDQVLFVGHHASRTGAPLLLLHFVRWLAANSNIGFEILLAQDGELAPKFAEIAPTRILGGSAPTNRVARLWRRIRKRLPLGPSLDRILTQHYPSSAFPLVYANTVANGEIVDVFGRRGHRIICHAHEMRFGIEKWGGQAGRDSARFVNSFIAASNAVKRDLVGQWGIHDSHIEVIHEFGQPVSMSATDQTNAHDRVRRDLGVSADEIVVGMCGTMDWRKGVDLFPLIAKAVLRRAGGRGFRFIWIGQPPRAEELLQLKHDLQFLGIADQVQLMGQVSNPHDYMSAFDLFVLTSREDPCPLVMIEAGSLGLPILCFADSGGATDFVRGDAGAIVPYLDVEAMGEAIFRYGSDPECRRRAGEIARARALGGFTLQTQAPKLLGVIDRNLRTSTGVSDALRLPVPATAGHS